MSDLRRVANRTVRLAQLGREFRDDVLLGSETGNGGSLTNPLTGAQTAQHANSSAASSASLSNTVPGYTTLGGRWQFAAPGGAATDFVLFSYQVPAGLRLWLESIGISAMNTGAAVATTATLLDWFLAVGDAASLADSSQRRLPLGVQGFPVSSPIGFVAQDFFRQFRAPIVIPSQKFLAIGVAVPVGTATTSQVIRGTATPNGFFEKV